MTVKATGSLL